MGGLNDFCVVEADSKGEPSLQNFRVLGARAVIVRVDVRHDGDVDLRLSKRQLVLENHFQVGVPAAVLQIVLRSAGSIQGDESVGELRGVTSLNRGEV